MLNLTLDAGARLLLEPGYKHDFTAAGLTRHARALDPFSARTLWNPPGTGIISLKPLQMLPDFLGHQAQLDQHCVLRFNVDQTQSDFYVNAIDIVNKAVTEIFIGTMADPWVNHVPASNIIEGPTRVVNGLPFATGLPDLQQVADQSETGSTSVFDTDERLPVPVPNGLTNICETFKSFDQNQGWLFRWWVTPELTGRHQQIYAFTFGQYCALCKRNVLDIYEDTSPHASRNEWTRRYRAPIFVPGQSLDIAQFNPDWALGKELASQGRETGVFASLLVLPIGRQKVLFLAHTGQYIIATVRAHPRRTADGQEWDILRAGPVSVWALTPQIGQFQVQKIKYPGTTFTTSGAGLSTLWLPDLIMDYTPLIFPTLTIHGDQDAGSLLVKGPLIFPKNYTFPAGPLDDDCPPPTSLASGQGRTFGEQIRFVASADQRVTPQLYSLELNSEPIFRDNPSPPLVVGDQAQGFGAHVLHAETSLGSNPGEGRLTVTVRDNPDPLLVDPPVLDPYRFRSEMPVRLEDFNDVTHIGTPIFSGYTDKIEVQPLRGDALAPVEYRFRCNDRWFLLENTILREQRDWQSVGHISVVDSILRQCGIDTGDLHNDGTVLTDGTPSRSGGSKAEYPAGWDGALSSMLNTPLGTPQQNNDNLEGNQLLGWRPQPHDTGASFLKRITDLYSNWLLGFRADGTPYYLPYKYFTSPSLIFHAHAGFFVESGLNLSSGVGLVVNVSPGTARIAGDVIAPANVVPVPPNATSTLFLMTDGTVTTNTTGMPPPNSVTLGKATTDGASVTSTDDTATSPRQTQLSRIFRRPLEYRTIEPSGNFVQVITHFQLDQTSNRSGLFVDWASFRNPNVVNYLGRPKWFLVEAGGAYSCAQLNRMAYIVFQAARRRRLRVSFDADFVPTLKIGQVFTLEGIGDFRLLEMRASFTRRGWEIANYTGEKVEKGYGLPDGTLPAALPMAVAAMPEPIPASATRRTARRPPRAAPARKAKSGKP